MKKTQQQEILASKIVTLKRNPQYLTPKQMESLKASIKRDGFCVPILVRSIAGEKYEVISGNHRFMAACEIGMEKIPCVIVKMTDNDAKRLAINLNTIHGEPNVELLAPFLAEMDLKTLAEIHVEDSLKRELSAFDNNLAAMLKELEVPDEFNHDSKKTKNEICVCPKCSRKHFKVQVPE